MDIEERNPDQEEVERHSDWLWSFLVEHTGEDRFFDAILGRGGGEHPPHPQNGSEIDRLILFRELVDYLVKLRGSEQEAANWLFWNPVFKKVAGAAPFDYLEDGEFQSLSLLHDWLQIACFVNHQPSSSTDPIFGSFETTTVLP